jgi:TonB family protein
MLESSFLNAALELTFKATAVLVAASAVSLLLWRASAAVRHLAWVLALGSLLLLPGFEALLPAWRAPMLAGVPVAISEVPMAVAAHGTPMPPPPAPARIPERTVFVTLAVWMAGVLVCLGRWRNGMAQVARLRSEAAPFEDERVSTLMRELAGLVGLRRPVKILASEGEIMPMAAGVLQPAILLPGNASRWPLDRLRVVLLHEMAHIQRNDGAVHALAELVCCFYWFHPLVWLALRRLRVERERACDDVVLGAGTKASDYAAHLLDLARSLHVPAFAQAAITAARPSHLEARLRGILNPRVNRRAFTPSARVFACLVTACLVVPLAAMRPQGGNSRMIAGTVYDPSSAVVPSAAVIVTNRDNNQKQTTATNPAGRFSMGPLAEGRYRLEVDARGFAPAVRSFTVDGTHDLRFDITVDLGKIEESLVVRGKGSPAAPPSAPHRVRVGGSVVPAKLVYQAKPEYPDDAKSRGVEGDVVLRVVISMEGAVLSLTSVSSPDPQLTEAAMNAVRQWRYEPSLLNGKPVETATTITVNFQLEP